MDKDYDSIVYLVLDYASASRRDCIILLATKSFQKAKDYMGQWTDLVAVDLTTDQWHDVNDDGTLIIEEPK